jgi:hypothetical protein
VIAQIAVAVRLLPPDSAHVLYDGRRGLEAAQHAASSAQQGCAYACVHEPEYVLLCGVCCRMC